MSILNDRKILVVEDDQYEIANIRKLLSQISGDFKIVETVHQAGMCQHFWDSAKESLRNFSTPV